MLQLEIVGVCVVWLEVQIKIMEMYVQFYLEACLCSDGDKRKQTASLPSRGVDAEVR